MDAGEKSSGTKILAILNLSCEPEPAVEAFCVILARLRKGIWKFRQRFAVVFRANGRETRSAIGRTRV